MQQTATILLALGCALAAPAADGLGQLSFPNSGAAEAQQPFLRGVLLLHSFEYEDAAEAFELAQQADPSFAMAYWGEALTYYHIVWNELDDDAGRAALAKLGPDSESRLKRAATERERGFLAAAEALYGSGPREERMLAYADKMRQLHQAYPDDDEATTFYAVSLFRTGGLERDFRLYMRIASIVEEVYSKNPQHPGALHYLIHCYDDPVHAPLGLRAARRYSKIAASAGHALHMPSHIFVALGMWDDVIQSNIDAFNAGDERWRRKQLPRHERNYHALWWLEYGYLQKGDFEQARRRLAVIEQDAAVEKAAAAGPTSARTHHAFMRAHFLIDSEQWDADVADLAEPDRLDSSLYAIDRFTSGFRALKQGDRRTSEAALEAMRARFREDGANDPLAAVMMTELEGALLLDSDPDKAIETLTLAAQAEDQIPFAFGPPVPVKPAHELLGEALLKLGRAAEAEAQFSKALERTPGRALSARGLERSRRADKK